MADDRVSGEYGWAGDLANYDHIRQLGYNPHSAEDQRAYRAELDAARQVRGTTEADW